MFNNLIESSSHKREFKRRGSFFMYTVVGYALLFAAGGVASIYAYDAHLDEQNAEITMLTFVPPEPVNPSAPAPVRNTAPRSNDNPRNLTPSAPELYDSPNNSRLTPHTIGTTPAPFPAAGRNWKVGDYNNPLNGAEPGSTERGPGGPGGSGVAVDPGTPPPPAPPTPLAPPKKIVPSSTILNSRALSLPKPAYPKMAQQIRLSGSVSVQVVIDETGKVISAKSASGHALLAPAAVQAAYLARFSPTMIGNTPVRVSGVIVYNFMLQ